MTTTSEDPNRRDDIKVQLQAFAEDLKNELGARIDQLLDELGAKLGSQ